MNKPVRVLQFSVSENIGGIETFLRNLIKQFDPEEIKFDFVTTYSSPAFKKEFQSYGATIYKIPKARRVIGYISALKKIMREGNYDVVHVNKNSGADLIPFIVAKKMKIPVIIAHGHNTKSTVGKGADIISCINRSFMSRFFTHSFASSVEAAEWLFGKKYCKTHKVPILKNGIDLSDYAYSTERREEIRHRLSLGDKFVVGHVGRFTQRKNHDFLVDIFAELHKIRPDSELLLVGTGPKMVEITRKVHKLGLSDSVMFMGAQDNINEYYAAMDAFVMPSLLEDLPVAAIEAQCAGLPVFVSNTVAEELDVTRNISWLSLEQDASIWANMVLNVSECFERTSQTDILKKSGYDIKETAEILKNVYLGK